MAATVMSGSSGVASADVSTPLCAVAQPADRIMIMAAMSGLSRYFQVRIFASGHGEPDCGRTLTPTSVPADNHRGK